MRVAPGRRALLGAVAAWPMAARAQGGRQLRNAAGRLATLPQRVTRVFYARGPQGLETGLAGSINTEIIEFCGAENVAAAQAGTDGLTQVSAEQVVLWNPDWIITPKAALAAAMPSHPLWRSLRAVRADGSRSRRCCPMAG
jgi:iron complex transport system substrate-binding protein